MRNLVLLALLVTLTSHGFMERFYTRMLLGSDTLAEVERVCRGKKYQHEYDAEYDALYTKLVNTPPPLIIQLLDRFSWQTRESRLAALWFDTGEAINSVLYTLILTSPLGMAVWYDGFAQSALSARYSKEAVDEFNGLMQNLELLRKETEKKIKFSGSWRPLYYRTEFKDADTELEKLLTKALGALVNLRLLISQLSPQLENSPFKMLAPAVMHVMAELSAIYRKLPFINQSSIKIWYNNMRKEALESAIQKCLPRLRVLAAHS